MILEVRAVPPIYKNGFVIACERTHDGIVIDPGDEVDELLAAVRDHDVHVTHILLTHAHVDHISGVDVAKEAFDAPIYLHQGDLPLYERVLQQGAMFDFKVRPQPPIDVFYDMSAINFGDYEIRLHHTPGHSPGGVTLEVGRKGQPAGHLFVGDALFAGSIGRTDLAGGNHAQLILARGVRHTAEFHVAVVTRAERADSPNNFAGSPVLIVAFAGANELGTAR